MDPKSNKWCHFREERERGLRRRDVGHVKMEAGSRVMLTQIKESQEPPEAGRCNEGLSPGAFRGSKALPTP